MSFQQSDDSDFPQPDSLQSDNVGDTTKFSIQSSRTCPSAPQDLISRGVFRSSNNGSEFGEWMLQKPVNWIVAHNNPPLRKPHTNNHELCRHKELFCMHAFDGFEASRNNFCSASNYISPKEERNDSKIHVHQGHQHTTENYMSAVVAPQVLKSLQPNTTQRLQHQTSRLAVPDIVNGNRNAQLHPHIQPPFEDRRYMQLNGSPCFQSHGYTQPTDLQSQPQSGDGTSVHVDPGMHNT
jgi:hypothetical protein